MPIGISTASLYPMDTSEALKVIAGFGIKHAEVFINTSSELEKGYLNMLKKTADDNGIKIAAIHPFTSAFESFMLFSGYKTRFYDMSEYYKKYYEAANILGAEVVVIHGDRKIGAVSDAEYFERFASLMENGRAQGVTVAQENVSMYRSADPEFIREMKRQIKDVRFVFDVKQAVRSGYDPCLVLESMNKNVIHVHLSDNIQHEGCDIIKKDLKDKTCLLPGKGNFSFKQLFESLKLLQYKGVCVIEVYRNAYTDIKELNQSAKKVLEFVEKNHNI